MGIFLERAMGLDPPRQTSWRVLCIGKNGQNLIGNLLLDPQNWHSGMADQRQ
jgi:hypothetical protein